MKRLRDLLLVVPFAAAAFTSCQTQKTECSAACADFYSDLELADWNQTLRKASMAIAGRLPDSFEKELVRTKGQAGLELVLDQMMKEEPFYDRLKEIYNDFLLTDRYLGDGTQILDRDRFPNAQYFDSYERNSPDFVANAYGANWGIGREPLNIIAHVVRNDRPFTEILTADYTLVNAYTAQSYGIFDMTFVGDPFSKENLLEVRLPAQQHVGLLTTPSFLNRFPTSATNRNRHRSRYIYKFFLDVDVMLLGTRPLTTSNIDSETPTMNDPACTSCHTTLDPIAGMFQNWDDEGHYQPPQNGWYKDMFKAGYNGEDFKGGNVEPLRWLAERVVKQPGFARAAVITMYKGLTGDDPVGIPVDDGSPASNSGFAAFKAQQDVFAEIGTRFKESSYNLKTVVKGIILSPYFRARNIKEGAAAERALDYAGIGMNRLLTPEMLSRKIQTVLALNRHWGERGQLEPVQYLLSNDHYLIYYGGIDSVATLTRITRANGIQANVARRMGNELACQTVALDLSQPRANRALFPFADANTLPENVDDLEAGEGDGSAAIRHNIKYLHDRILDEQYELDDEQLLLTYDLFISTLRDGRARLAAGETPVALPNECRGTRDHWTNEENKKGLSQDPDYTIRAWMAVVSYMLGDYKFLYE